MVDVITKKVREDFKISKSTKLLVSEEEHFLVLLSETSLEKTWNNRYDHRWDDAL